MTKRGGTDIKCGFGSSGEGAAGGETDGQTQVVIGQCFEIFSEDDLFLQFFGCCGGAVVGLGESEEEGAGHGKFYASNS